MEKFKLIAIDVVTSGVVDVYDSSRVSRLFIHKK